MSETNAGSAFPLNNKNAILQIDSPKNSIEVFKVIFVEENERWAVVAANWDEEPRLCMRWFWGKTGFPQSRGLATWMVITPKLADAILSKFLINPAERSQIDKFLIGELEGKDL
jgi:hypothetical protein